MFRAFGGTIFGLTAHVPAPSPHFLPLTAAARTGRDPGNHDSPGFHGIQVRLPCAKHLRWLTETYWYCGIGCVAGIGCVLTLHAIGALCVCRLLHVAHRTLRELLKEMW